MSALELTEEQLRTLRAAATILGVPVGTLPTALPAALSDPTDAPQSSIQHAGAPGNASLSCTSDLSVPTAGDLVPITSSFSVPEPSNGWNAEAQATSLALSDAAWDNPSSGLNDPAGSGSGFRTLPYTAQYTPQFSQPPPSTFPSNTTHFLQANPNAVPLPAADFSTDLTFDVDNIGLDFEPTSNNLAQSLGQDLAFTAGLVPSQLTNTFPLLTASAGADFLCDGFFLGIVGNDASPNFSQATEQGNSNYIQLATTSSASQQPATIPAAPARQNEGIRTHKPIRPHSTRGDAPNLSRGVPKRKTYSEAERLQTSLTRSMRMCMKCRLSRKRCVPDPINPTGPCLPCQKVVFNTFKLPCLRYKITDCYLYRTVSNDSFEAAHVGTGPRFGDFHLRKIWVGDENEIRTFALSQRRGTTLNLRVRQFEPPIEPDESTLDLKGVGGKGRAYYSIPWAIANLDEAVKAVNDFVDDSTLPYIDKLIGHSKPLASTVFNEARRLAYGHNPNVLVRQALRLWVAARFLEGGWRCAGEDMLGAEKMSPPWRSKDDIALPPYIDFQFSSIIAEKILGPLSRDVLKSLENLVLKNQSKNWFTIFLVVFILMHSYELILQHEVAFTTRRKYPLKYYDMKLIRGYQSGAKTLLAHFHYVNKGNIPFQPQFDWNSSINKHMADLSEDELRTVTKVSHEVSQTSELLQSASTTDKYEEPFWFIGQVFEKSWDPRITCEHSPPLEADNEN